MKSKIILILLMVLVIPAIFAAYSDYGINDIIVPQSIKDIDDLNFSMIVANNSAVISDIDVTISVLNSNNSVITHISKVYSVPANSTKTFSESILAGDMNLVSSTEPYSVFASITNEVTGNTTNNTYKKYFNVRKGDRKIPVPDMPIVLGFVIALSIVFILARDETKKSKIKRK